MSNVLIVYYSHSGNTKRIAQIIQKITKGDIFSVLPDPAYPKDYEEVLDVTKQQRDLGSLPKLLMHLDTINQYEYIFIGTPNWWSTVSLPILSFLKNNNLMNKTIIPFITHGGGGTANIVHDMKQICPNAIFLKELSLYGDASHTTEAPIEDWINKQLKIIK